MNVSPKPSPRFAEYVRKIKCGEWESLGPLGSDKGALRHTHTGQTVAYNTHDGGNEWNGARNFALTVQRICGCRLIEPRGRKRSRKAFRPSGFRVETSRPNPAVSARITELDERHAELRKRWDDLTANPTRENALAARQLLAEASGIEDELEALYQPVDRIGASA